MVKRLSFQIFEKSETKVTLESSVFEKVTLKSTITEQATFESYVEIWRKKKLLLKVRLEKSLIPKLASKFESVASAC